MDMVTFRVNFESITKRVREMWADGEWINALQFFEEMGIPKEQAHEVIRGNLKMTQNPKGEEGIDGMLVEDNWRPRAETCHYLMYPDPDEIPGLFKKILKYRDNYFNILFSEFSSIERKWAAASDVGNGSRLEDLVRYAKTIFPPEFFELSGIPQNFFELGGVDQTIYGRAGESRTTVGDFQDEPVYSEKTDKMEMIGFPSVHEYIARQIELEKTPPPEPSKSLESKWGWIHPSGRYYGCKRTEHLWVPNKLENINEKQAEMLGWIKISTSLDGDTCIFPGNKEPTDAQAKTLRNWCEVHNHPFPSHIFED